MVEDGQGSSNCWFYSFCLLNCMRFNFVRENSGKLLKLMLSCLGF